MGTIIAVEHQRPNAWCNFKTAVIQMDNGDIEKRSLLQCLWKKGKDGVPECR